MKTRLVLSATFALLLAGLVSRAADQTVRFDSKSGPNVKIRIEGTSTVHDWQVEGPLIGGFVEAGPGFPTEPGQQVAPGKVQARVEAFIPVRALKSVEKDGSHYSDKMDEIMFEKLKSQQHARIVYRLNELTLKESPKSKDLPYVFDSKGELVVAGVTNKIAMAVNVTPLGENKLKLTGNTKIKMSDYGIQPPVLIGVLSTGDEVTLGFEWMVVQKNRPAASGATPAAPAGK
jgi:hypothetical protein